MDSSRFTIQMRKYSLPDPVKRIGSGRSPGASGAAVGFHVSCVSMSMSAPRPVRGRSSVMLCGDSPRPARLVIAREGVAK